MEENRSAGLPCSSHWRSFGVPWSDYVVIASTQPAQRTGLADRIVRIDSDDPILAGLEKGVYTSSTQTHHHLLVLLVRAAEQAVERAVAVIVEQGRREPSDGEAERGAGHSLGCKFRHDGTS